MGTNTNRHIRGVCAAALLLFACACAAGAEERVTHFGSGALKPEAKEPRPEMDKAARHNLLRSLTDADFNKRVDAQWQLRMLGDRSITPDLTALLQDKRPYVRQLSCELLGEVGDKSCISAVTAVLLNDPDYHVREVAARTLMMIGDRSVVEALVAAVNQPRPFPDTVGYWLFPNDIYDNYRYAAAETLNRLTHNNFYLRRNATNFDRIRAQKEINRWWRENKLYYTREIDTITDTAHQFAKAAKDLKGAAGKLSPSQSGGPEELAHRMDTYADRAKDAYNLVTALPAQKQKLFEILRELNDLTTSIDEIYVFSDELSPVKGDWENVKSLHTRLTDQLGAAGVREEQAGKPSSGKKR